MAPVRQHPGTPTARDSVTQRIADGFYGTLKKEADTATPAEALNAALVIVRDILHVYHDRPELGDYALRTILESWRPAERAH